MVLVYFKIYLAARARARRNIKSTELERVTTKEQ